MKKLIVLIVCLLLSGIHVFGLGCKNCPPPPPNNTPPCETERINLSLNGFQINASKFSFHNPIWYFLQDALNDGCEIDVGVKTRGTQCTYTSTKTYKASNKEELAFGNLIPIDVPVGHADGYDITITVYSPCVWEQGAYVHHTWIYTVSYMYLGTPCNMLFSGTVACRNNAGGGSGGDSSGNSGSDSGGGASGVGGPSGNTLVYLAHCNDAGILY